jgi:hypothetical protein
MSMPAETQKKDDGKLLFWGLTLLRGWASVPLVFLRVNFGRNAIGMDGVGGCLVIVTYAVTQRIFFLEFLLYVYLLALLFQKLRTAYIIKKGWQSHSRYYGDSWLANKFPVGPTIQRMAIEPSIVFFFGMALAACEYRSGQFFMLSAMAMILKEAFENHGRLAQDIEFGDLDFELKDRFARFRN